MPVINFPLRLLFLLALLLPLAIGAATAQVPATPPAAPATISAADLEAALATLTNDDQREKLVAQLRSLAEARRAVQPATVARPFGAQIFDQSSEKPRASERRSWRSAATPSISRTRGSGSRPSSPIRTSGANGWRSCWRWSPPSEPAFSSRRACGGCCNVRGGPSIRWRPLIRFVLLLVRTLLEMVPVLAFAAAGYAVLSFMAMSGSARVAALAIVNANVLTRLVVALAKMVLSPEVPSLRFVGISDVAAARMFRAVPASDGDRRLRLLPHPRPLHPRHLDRGLRTAAEAARHRGRGLPDPDDPARPRPVADKLRGRGHDDSGTARCGRGWPTFWHVLAIVYVVAICGVWVMQVDEGFTFIFRATLLSLVILVAARIAMTLADQGLRRGFPIGAELHNAFPTLQHDAEPLRADSTPGHPRRDLGRGGAGLLSGLERAVLRLAGRELFGAALRIGLLVGVAIAIWEMLRAGLTRVMRRPGVNGVAQPSARARTLIPLIEKFSFIVLVIIVGLMVLAEVGVDIAPLLAGAGIIGIAVGFGAQSLVKDVITGLFILLEDQFSVGDVVNVAGKGGLVEDISLRTIRLRDYDGTLFIIPYSEVGTTANLTKGFSYYVFNVGVSYREDVDEVIRVLRGLGEEMEQDPEFGPLMMAPLDIAGLDKFDNSAVIIKCRMKTLPSSNGPSDANSIGE